MPEAAPTAAIPGARKAAILMVLLGEDTAGKLLQHLPRGQMSRIAREVVDLGPIDPAVASQVLREYFVEAIRPTEESGGLEVARRLLSRAAIPEDQQDRLLGRAANPAAKILAPLLDAPVEVLSAVLAEEHPQTVAVVLVNMPPQRASRVLRALPDAVRAETVLRMAGLRQVRGEVLGDVATSLQEGLRGRAPAEAEGALQDAVERTASVLANLSRGDARQLIEEVKREQPEQGLALQSRLFTFESLLNADDRGVQEMLREVEAKRVALALKGAPETIANKFFSNLSERAATMLKDEMEFLGQLRPEEQLEARRELVELALKLEADGRLTFAEVEGAGEGEDV